MAGKPTAVVKKLGVGYVLQRQITKVKLPTRAKRLSGVLKRLQRAKMFKDVKDNKHKKKSNRPIGKLVYAGASIESQHRESQHDRTKRDREFAAPGPRRWASRRRWSAESAAPARASCFGWTTTLAENYLARRRVSPKAGVY